MTEQEFLIVKSRYKKAAKIKTLIRSAKVNVTQYDKMANNQDVTSERREFGWRKFLEWKIKLTAFQAEFKAL